MSWKHSGRRSCQNGIQTNPVLLYHLGMAYAKNGQKKEAKDALEKALKLNSKFPGYKQAQEALVLLQR